MQESFVPAIPTPSTLYTYNSRPEVEESPVVSHDTLERVRALCLVLPETEERLSHGEPTFFVRGKRAFVSYSDNHHGDGRLALVCNAPPEAQAARVASDPRRFFVPPYVGGRGWIGVRLDMAIDWDEIAEIIADAYRLAARGRRR